MSILNTSCDVEIKLFSTLRVRLHSAECDFTHTKVFSNSGENSQLNNWIPNFVLNAYSNVRSIAIA